MRCARRHSEPDPRIFHAGVAQHRGEPAKIADDFRLRLVAGVARARGAFGGAGAERDARRPSGHTSGRLQDVRIVDVDRRALDEQAAEHARAGDDRVDRGEAAGRRSADAAPLRFPCDAIARLDERDHLVHQERRIARALRVRLGRAEESIDPGKVLAEALVPAGVVDADDDDRRDAAGRGQLPHGLVHAPLAAGERRRRRVEQVLAVVQVERRISPLAVLGCVVAGREQDAQRPRVPERGAREGLEAQVAVGTLAGQRAGGDGERDDERPGLAHPAILRRTALPQRVHACVARKLSRGGWVR